MKLFGFNITRIKRESQSGAFAPREGVVDLTVTDSRPLAIATVYRC